MATLFAAPPHEPVPPGARAFHHQCGLGDDAMAHRQIEDVTACAAVGSRPLHLGLLEALYRVDADGAPRHPDGRAIFHADPSNEPDVVDHVQMQITALVDELRPDLVLGPLGIGAHIDHLLTCRALRRCDIEPGRVRWYEDVPYAMYERHLGWSVIVQRTLRPELLPVDGMSWQAKITGVGCYRSQHSVLWHDPAPWQTQLRDYALAIGGGKLAERLWHATGEQRDQAPARRAIPGARMNALNEAPRPDRSTQQGREARSRLRATGPIRCV